jgi:hypothetical protein
MVIAPLIISVLLVPAFIFVEGKVSPIPLLLATREFLMHDSTIGKTPNHTSRTMETFGIWGHDAHGILFSCLVSYRCPMNVRLWADRSDCRWGTYTYYLVLVAQQVLGLSAIRTGTQLIPFCVWGKLEIMKHGIAADRVN